MGHQTIISITIEHHPRPSWGQLKLTGIGERWASAATNQPI